MKAEFSLRALANLEDIADYLTPLNPNGAANVRKAILSTIDTVAQFPLAGRRQSVASVRRIGVPHYQYSVYYTVETDADRVVVVAIRHDKRRRTFTDR